MDKPAAKSYFFQDLPTGRLSGLLCQAAWKKHQQSVLAHNLTVGPVGRVRLDYSQMLSQIPFFLGAPRDPPAPGECCHAPWPNPELILQCLLLTETLLGKLRRHEVLSLL